ncbi:MAG: hypothetical protein AAGG46_06930, partial [Planctomycetota bacterium]
GNSDQAILEQSIAARVDETNSSPVITTADVIDTDPSSPTFGEVLSTQQITFNIADESVANGEIEFNRYGEVERVQDRAQESFAENVVVSLFADVWDGNQVVAGTNAVETFLTGADGNYYFDVVPPKAFDPIDTSNLTAGDVVQYRVSVADPSGGRTVLTQDPNALDTDPTSATFGQPLVIGDNGEVALPKYKGEWNITRDYFFAEDHEGTRPEFVTVESPTLGTLQLFSLVDGGFFGAGTTPAVFDANGNAVVAAYRTDDPFFSPNDLTPIFLAAEIVTNPDTLLPEVGDLLTDPGTGDFIEVDYVSDGLDPLGPPAGELGLFDSADPATRNSLLVIQDDRGVGFNANGINDLFFFAADPGITNVTGVSADLGLTPIFLAGNNSRAVTIDGATGEITIPPAMMGDAEFANTFSNGANHTITDDMGTDVEDALLEIVAGGQLVTVENDITGDLSRNYFFTPGNALPIVASAQVDFGDLQFLSDFAALNPDRLGPTSSAYGGILGGSTSFVLDPTQLYTSLAQQVTLPTGGTDLAPVVYLDPLTGAPVMDDADNINFLLSANPAETGPATFSGTVFTDNDGDGSFDAVAGDTLTQNARVFIDTNRD